jgi:hypothetical protein
MEALVRNLQGLTLDEALRIVHGAVLRDSRLDESDVEQVLVAKREALGRDGLLEFYPPWSWTAASSPRRSPPPFPFR